MHGGGMNLRMVKCDRVKKKKRKKNKKKFLGHPPPFQTLERPASRGGLACWWGLWNQAASWAARCSPNLINSAPLPVPGSGVFARREAAGIITHRPRHQCRTIPDKRHRPLRPPADFYFLTAAPPEQSVALKSSRWWAKRIRRAFGPRPPIAQGAGAVPDGRAVVCGPRSPNRAAAAAQPRPTQQVERSAAFCPGRQR